MSAKEPDSEGIHISRNQLTLLSVIAGGAIIFFAFQHSQTPGNTTLPLQPEPIVQTPQQPVVSTDTGSAMNGAAMPKDTSEDLPALVKEWSSRVVRIGCADSTYVSSGSGVLTRMDFSSIGKPNAPTLITNKHVITNPSTGYLYSYCGFQTTDGSQVLSIGMDIAQQSNNYDVAYFPSSATNPPPGARSVMKVCKPTDAVVGDKVAILGYPVNGGTGEASKAITLTSGVISSFDGDYYVTDAKIDHGNSGGAAILLKNDCYLGIPTWVQSGGFESLGRILSAEDVLTPN